MQDKKNILEKYANLKALEKQTAEELKFMKPEVEAIILDINPNDDSKVETEFGVFSMVPKRTYRYSEDVTTLQDKLDEMKETEEQTGKAEYVIKPYLKFSEVKQ